MPYYRYVHASSLKKRKAPPIFSYLLMGGGFLILAWTFWPIVSFFAVHQMPDVLGVWSSSPTTEGFLAPMVFASSNDESLSDVNRWYPNRPQKRSATLLSEYTLSIPKLSIENARVMVAGDDLAKSLIHYGGTSLPGQNGTSVIFGHSTLPQFFDQTNYKSIFSTLPKLSVGDTIILTADSTVYTYKIYDTKIVAANDLTALEQQTDDSYLTLVTCVPPGTYWKRLNVHAKLERL